MDQSRIHFQRAIRSIGRMKNETKKYVENWETGELIVHIEMRCHQLERRGKREERGRKGGEGGKGRS